jgi:hypothetical protein
MSTINPTIASPFRCLRIPTNVSALEPMLVFQRQHNALMMGLMDRGYHTALFNVALKAYNISD